MGAPRYKSSNYDSAKEKYDALQEKYTGDEAFANAQKLSEETANKQSIAVGRNAGDEARKQARTAGLSRSQSAKLAAANASAATKGAYSNLYNTTLQNKLQANANTVNAGAATLNAASQVDQNKYGAEKSRYDVAWGANLLGSDERLKDIKGKDADYFLALLKKDYRKGGE